jgi:branched-chain amino acid transport system permease protein
VNDLMFNLLIGLGIGSLYACLGAGLVISFKGSGVINFAHGAMAMYGIFTFDRAWSGGEFFLPLVDFLPTSTVNVPVRITLSSAGRWPMIPSLILALLMAAALGLAAHFLVFRPSFVSSGCCAR